MNQFIIENPVFSIVIAFIIGAVIMNITSAITVRMAVEKEVERALGEEDEMREVRERQREELRKEIMENLAPPVPPSSLEQVSKIDENSDILQVVLGVDEDGCRCLYLAMPTRYKGGEGPLAHFGHDYYYHPTLQFLVDDFDLAKLAELDINIRPEGEYEPMAFSAFIFRGQNVLKFLEEAFNACSKAIAERE